MISMTALTYTVLAIAGVSCISFVGLLALPHRIGQMRSLLLVLVGLAAGALLGDAFIHLIPEAYETLGEGVAVWILAGMGVFFVLEKFLHSHHDDTMHVEGDSDCHNCDDEHIAPFGKLIIVSDSFHNIIDGVIIAAGFLVSVEVGIATTIAVALHEIPQEIGDFGALLHAGFSRAQALLVNFFSALTAFLGAFLVFFIGSSIEGIVPILSALTAGGFIYIAATDLIPELHTTPRVQQSAAQLTAILLGVGIMFGLASLESNEGASDGGSITYRSEQLGVSFEYPSTYFITERELGDAHRRHHSIQIIEDTQFNRDLVAGKVIGTEGPTAMSIDAYQNDLDGYTTEQWVRGHSASNFKLSDGELLPVLVDDYEGLRYRWSGLYEADNIAVATPPYVFSFSATYLNPTDVIRNDFEELIKTVEIR